MSESALEVQGVSLSFGGFQALRDVSLQVAPGERRLILGPNGAGKSCLFGVIAGQLRPSAGRVFLMGRDVSPMSAYRRARRGLARTFQLNSLFPSLTVRQNVDLAVFAAAGVRWTAGSRRRRELREKTQRLLAQWNLLNRAETETSLLSYGERRRLELALALAGSPKVLLLDEPTAGLTAQEGHQLLDIIEQLPRDVAVIMIEHDMSIANRFAERITVLATGEVIADGAPDEVRADPRVRKSYLGETNG